ncbi:hypothetical protein WHX55_22635 [Pseudomonas fluorescens]|uniref:hypothetical protein n=1 Tax=Pseudomonas fluorescens TaxID=294 RepID=UPI003245EC71
MTLTKFCTAFLGLCLSLAIVSYAESKPFLTVVCDPPVGVRIDVGGLPAQKSGNPFNFSEDSFTGVNPTFIVDDTDLNTLTYMFGNTKPETGPALSQRSARSAHIIALSSTMISATETTEDAIAVFSLYSTLKLGFFTFHVANPGGGADAKAMTFVAKCSFAA